MGSNISIRISFSQGKVGQNFFQIFDACLNECGFKWGEIAADISERAFKIPENGHIAFVIFFGNDSRAAQGFFNFFTKGSIKQIFLQPGQLWVGAQSYMSSDYEFLLALHELVRRCFEDLNADEAAAYLDEIDQPWFRFSRKNDSIPLPEIVVDDDEE
jgi:hypothetical protein